MWSAARHGCSQFTQWKVNCVNTSWQMKALLPVSVGSNQTKRWDVRPCPTSPHPCVPELAALWAHPLSQTHILCKHCSFFLLINVCTICPLSLIFLALPPPCELLLIFEDQVQVPVPHKSTPHPQPVNLFTHCASRVPSPQRAVTGLCSHCFSVCLSSLTPGAVLSWRWALFF